GRPGRPGRGARGRGGRSLAALAALAALAGLAEEVPRQRVRGRVAPHGDGRDRAPEPPAEALDQRERADGLEAVAAEPLVDVDRLRIEAELLAERAGDPPGERRAVERHRCSTRSSGTNPGRAAAAGPTSRIRTPRRGPIPTPWR